MSKTAVAINALPSPAAPVFAPAVKVGQKVWYIPDLCHQLDKDNSGNYLFVFQHTKNSSSPRFSYRAGDSVTDFGTIGGRRLRRIGDGIFRTGGGHIIGLVGPGEAWPAVVREVFTDGTLALDIAHPLGGSLKVGHAAFESGTFLTLHYPSPGATAGLRYSKTYEPHTWHLFDERKGVTQ